ncbi:SEL1-like repeat protein, partial [Myxococcota bacterium]|nr:SEL1-like repeat protein [Myxococcota bacterium]
GTAGITARLSHHFTACAGGSTTSCETVARYIPPSKSGLKEMTTVHRGMKELCARDNLYACYWLGLREINGFTTDLKPRMGPAHLEKACTGSNSAMGCRELSALYASGDLVAKSPERSLTLLKKACAAKDATACLGVATHLAFQTPTASHVEAVKAKVRLACRYGEDEACQLSDCSKYPRGRWKMAAVSRDSRVAHEFFITLCTAGNRYACVEKAVQSLRGIGAVKALDSARKSLVSLCHKNEPSACLQLGLVHLGGFAGSQPELTTAVRFLSRACTGGSGVACGRWGLALIYKKQYSAALRPLTVACDRGHIESCRHLGILYTGHLKKLPDATMLALNSLSLACRLNDPSSCAQLAHLHFTTPNAPPNKKIGVSMVSPLCNLGYMKACAALAAIYGRGEGVSPNLLTSLNLGRSSCACGNALGCAMAAEALLKGGPGFSKNLVSGHTYFIKSCALGFGDACLSLGRMNWEGVGIPVNKPRAFRFFDMACNEQRWKPACDHRSTLKRPVVAPPVTPGDKKNPATGEKSSPAAKGKQ